MNKTVNAFLITAGAILIYSFLCRSLGIYFFWESSSLGWTVLFVGLILLSINLIRQNKAKGKNTIGQKILIGVVSFILLVQVIFNVAVHNSAAYAVAKSYIIKNDSLKREVGEINGFGFTSSGSVSSTSSVGQEENAHINLIVKGNKNIRILLLM